MTDNNNYRPLRSRGFAALVAIHVAIAAVLTLLCLGCSRKTAPRAADPVVLHDASVRTDTVLVTAIRTDTVRLIERVSERIVERDSVVPVVGTDGKVTGYDRWHWRDKVSMTERERERLQAVIDSLREAGHDTVYREIPVPYEVEKVVEKERKPPWTERVRLAAFPWLCVAMAALGAWTFRRPLWRLLRQITGK